MGLSHQERGTQLPHVGSGAATGRPRGSGPAPDAPERPLRVLAAAQALCGLLPAQVCFYGNLHVVFFLILFADF